MSEAQAKRRYKILMRDKTRLDERGATDSTLNHQIAKLVEQFPSLEGADVVKKVSDSTKSMLRAGEEMSKDDDAPGQPGVAVEGAQEKTEVASTTSVFSPPAAPAACDGSTTKGKEDSAPQTPASPPSPPPTPTTAVQKKNDTTPDASAPEAKKEATTSTDETSSAPAAKKNKNNNGGSLERIATFLGVVNVVLRIWNDLRATPTFGPKNHAKALLCAMICGALHCHFLEPCSIFGRMADPMLVVFYLHLSTAFGDAMKQKFAGKAGGATPSSHRNVVERVFVYTLRDLIPSLMATYVVFMLYLTWASLTIGATPSLFCGDE